MTQNIQNKAVFGGDDMVEAAVCTVRFAPACVADTGQVRQGGLHNLLPWFVKIFGA